jgi:hypothetical protein
MSMEKPNERDSDLVFWTRWWLERIPSSEFLEIRSDEQLRAAQAESAWWGGDHFNPGASRYVPGRDEKHCFHIGKTDVLSHQYEVAGLKLTVLETAAEILTRVDVDLGPPAGNAMAVQRIAATLFRGGAAPLHFFPWKAKDESARFSTDPVGAMGMPPQDTISGSIAEGRVYFLINKSADPRRNAAGPPPTDNWLGGPLLAAWNARPGQP